MHWLLPSVFICLAHFLFAMADFKRCVFLSSYITILPLSRRGRVWECERERVAHVSGEMRDVLCAVAHDERDETRDPCPLCSGTRRDPCPLCSGTWRDLSSVQWHMTRPWSSMQWHMISRRRERERVKSSSRGVWQRKRKRQRLRMWKRCEWEE